MKLAILLLAALHLASAALNDVYSFSLYANGDRDGKCQAQGSKLGDFIQAKFDSAIGFTPYDGGVRFVRDRNLQINLCTRT